MCDVRLWRRLAVLVAPAVLVTVPMTAGAAAAAATPGTPVAVQGTGRSIVDGLSAGGRFVLVQSTAPNLVPGDTNGADDLFLRDRATGTTRLVDVTTTGAVSARGVAAFASLSADGRYVAFSSGSPDLVPGDTSPLSGTFLRDLRLGTTERISVRPDGSAADGGGWPSGVSRGGRFVVFVTAASDLDPADTAAFPRSVYVRDRLLHTTRRVVGVPLESLAPGWNAAVSPNGRFVAATLREPPAVAGGPAGDWGVTLFDLAAGTAERISLAPDGSPGNAEVDADAVSSTGRAVLQSAASNLVPGDANGSTDVFARDRRAGTRLVSSAPGGAAADGGSGVAAISANGRFVAFRSTAADLVAGDTNSATDLFVRDLRTGTTTRIDLAPSGRPTGDDRPSGLAISADGQLVAFTSTATDLVPGDTNGAADAFVHDLRTGGTERVSVG